MCVAGEGIGGMRIGELSASVEVVLALAQEAVEVRWNKPLRKVTHTHAHRHMDWITSGDGDDGVVLIAN